MKDLKNPATVVKNVTLIASALFGIWALLTKDAALSAHLLFLCGLMGMIGVICFEKHNVGTILLGVTFFVLAVIDGVTCSLYYGGVFL